MNYSDFIEKLDRLMALVYKYEIHAFLLVVIGAGLCLAGAKEVGFSLVTTGCTVFKNKFGAQ
jgi:hypothetical protein